MRKFSSFLLLFIILLILWGVQIEPRLLFVKNVDLFIPNWPKSLNDTKVAVISDLHIGSKSINFKKIEKIVQKINAEDPDLIFILGDYDTYLISKSKIPPERISKSLKKLKAKYGVVSILGNHDIAHQEIVKDMLSNAKIKLLEDEKVNIKIKNKNINVIGSKDLWHFPDTRKVVNMTKKTKGPILFLAHNPDTFDDIPPNISLILSGHNHGGEVRFPFVGAPFVPSEYGQRFIKGHVAENNKHIYITSGIGSLTRVRFGNIPEIVILHLYSQDGEKQIIADTTTHKNFGKGLIKRQWLRLAKYWHRPNW